MQEENRPKHLEYLESRHCSCSATIRLLNCAPHTEALRHEPHYSIPDSFEVSARPSIYKDYKLGKRWIESFEVKGLSREPWLHNSWHFIVYATRVTLMKRVPRLTPLASCKTSKGPWCLSGPRAFYSWIRIQSLQDKTRQSYRQVKCY